MIRQHSGMVCFATVFLRNKVILHFIISGLLEYDMLMKHVCISIRKDLRDYIMDRRCLAGIRLGRGRGFHYLHVCSF